MVSIMKLLTPFTCICLGLLLFISSIESHASDLETHETQVKDVMIPLSGEQIKQHKVGPKRGQSMKQVELKFGKATKIHPTKGNPPITRWDYPEFSVYFESKFVIHTVSHSN